MRHLLLDQVLPLIAGGATRPALHASVSPRGPERSRFWERRATASRRWPRASRPRVSARQRRLLRAAAQAGRLRSGAVIPGVRLAPDAVADIFAGARSRPIAWRTIRPSDASPTQSPASTFAKAPPAADHVLAPLRDLKRARTLAIRGRSAREGLLDLVNFTFHLDVEDPVRVRHAFELAADVAASCDSMR